MFNYILNYFDRKGYDIELLLGINVFTLLFTISLSLVSAWSIPIYFKWPWIIYTLTFLNIATCWFLSLNLENRSRYDSKITKIINSFVDEDLDKNILPKKDITELYSTIDNLDFYVSKDKIDTLFTKTLTRKFVQTNLKEYISIWPYRNKPTDIPDPLISGLHHIVSEYSIDISPVKIDIMATSILKELQEGDFKEWFFKINHLPETTDIYDWVNAYIDTFENNLNYIDDVIMLAIDKGIKINKEHFKQKVLNEIYLKKKIYLASVVSGNMYSDNPIQFLSIKDIDRLDGVNKGVKFENILSHLFLAMGFETVETPTVGDYGADLIVKKFGKKIAVQAKCYSNTVGLEAVQEIVSAKKYYNCENAMVITNNTYTNSARELAKVNNVILWGRTKLIKQIDTYPIPKSVIYN